MLKKHKNMVYLFYIESCDEEVVINVFIKRELTVVRVSNKSL